MSGTMDLRCLEGFCLNSASGFPNTSDGGSRRHVGDRFALAEEPIDDWTQDLCLHMSSLPATSKYRKAGKRDVIETFDPFRHFGANLPRFLNYVNRCLANRFRTIHSNRMKNPVSVAPIRCPSLDVGGDGVHR